MSLNYDLRKISDDAKDNFVWRQGNPEFGENPEERYMTSEAQGIIFATMAIGMGEITAKNYGQFYYRYRVLSDSIEPLDGGRECWLKLDMVRQMIGLSTNVFPMETDAKFHKRMMENYARRVRIAVACEADALIEAGTIESRPTV